MGDLGHPVRGGEEDVVAVSLGFGEQVVGGVGDLDQEGKVGKAPAQGVGGGVAVDGDPLPAAPGGVVPALGFG